MRVNDKVLTVFGCFGTIEKIDAEKYDRRYLVRVSKLDFESRNLRSDLLALNAFEIS